MYIIIYIFLDLFISIFKNQFIDTTLDKNILTHTSMIQGEKLKYLKPGVYK